MSSQQADNHQINNDSCVAGTGTSCSADDTTSSSMSQEAPPVQHADDKPRMTGDSSSHTQEESLSLSKLLQSEEQRQQQQRTSSEQNNNNKNNPYSSSFHQPPSEDSVYNFYRQVIPALLASIPILFARMASDMTHRLTTLSGQIWRFLIPSSSSGDGMSFNLLNSNSSAASSRKALVDSIINFFDSDEDGYITNLEIADVKEKLSHFEEVLAATLQEQKHSIESKWRWLIQSWPMMDWKVGIFLWRSCGGLLLVLFILSIIPGRFHRVSGRILRWPVLGITYTMVAVELCVYVILRLFILLAETLVANPKHRKWRKEMEQATSYKQWYGLARKLDESKGRHKWQRSVEDQTSSRYNWAFVKELISDLRAARKSKDTIRTLAVLQQCTRKNVGGIMSEDLFSYMQTGETKYVVNEFADEVVQSLQWITHQVQKDDDLLKDKRLQHEEEHQYESKVQELVKEEKEKVREYVGSFRMMHSLGQHILLTIVVSHIL
jgi:hypothetical protein